MTDNEIIGRLIDNASYSCDTCIFDNEDCENEQCQMETAKAAVDLIARKNAEIERYKGVIKILENDVKTSRYEAIREFAEKLKEVLKNAKPESPNKTYLTAMHDMLDYYVPKIIDNTVKEMEARKC